MPGIEPGLFLCKASTLLAVCIITPTPLQASLMQSSNQLYWCLCFPLDSEPLGCPPQPLFLCHLFNAHIPSHGRGAVCTLKESSFVLSSAVQTGIFQQLSAFLDLFSRLCCLPGLTSNPHARPVLCCQCHNPGDSAVLQLSRSWSHSDSLLTPTSSASQFGHSVFHVQDRADHLSLPLRQPASSKHCLDSLFYQPLPTAAVYLENSSQNEHGKEKLDPIILLNFIIFRRSYDELTLTIQALLQLSHLISNVFFLPASFYS